jgi:hypothetical protein
MKTNMLIRRIAVPAVVLAVAIALPVGAFAAPKAPTLITGQQIQDESVTGADIQNDSVTGADLIESTLGTVPTAAALDHQITGDEVQNDSLTGADVDESTLALPASGLSGYEVVTRTENDFQLGGPNFEPERRELTVDCPSGKVPTGGGANFDGGTQPGGAGGQFEGSWPTSTGWAAAWRAASTSYPDFIQAHVYVVCVDAS